MFKAIKHLLVPVDFSVESANALCIAASIAQRTGAEILLLHVIDSLLFRSMVSDEETLPHDLPDASMTQNPVANMLTRTREQLIAFAAEHTDYKRVKPCVIFQNIHRGIMDYARHFSGCLIVMGSKGMNESNYLIGSNTERVIRTAKAPVLVVKGNIPDLVLRNICWASDFYEMPPNMIAFMRSLRETFDSTLHLLKVITPQNFESSSHTLYTLRTFAKLHALDDCTVNYYNHYTEYEGILAFAKDRRVDLICMATYGNRGIMHALMGSTAEEVANHSPIAVLVFNYNA